MNMKTIETFREKLDKLIDIEPHWAYRILFSSAYPGNLDCRDLTIDFEKETVTKNVKED